MTPVPRVGFIATLLCLCLGPTAATQIAPPQLEPPFSFQMLETGAVRDDGAIHLHGRENHDFKSKPKDPVRFHKANFIILSAGVYAAGLADMHRTLEKRKLPWWYETDPLARPFVQLPTPAYYATGLAMATGINWLSWKMGHSRRWRKLSFLPQVLTIGGNLYGFQSNRH